MKQQKALSSRTVYSTFRKYCHQVDGRNLVFIPAASFSKSDRQKGVCMCPGKLWALRLNQQA